jgi:hypothetical protein
LTLLLTRVFGLTCLLLCVLSAHAQLPEYVPEEDLIAWYGFNSNAEDASSNALHGTTIETTLFTDRAGNLESAFHFNGNTSEVSVPFDPLFNSYPFTVSLWCKAENDANGGIIIQRYTNGSWNGWAISMSGTASEIQTVSPGYMLQQPPNCNGIVSNAQCGAGINSSHTLFDHQWHMLTFTVDGDSGRFYFDGLLQTTQAWAGEPGAPTGTSNLRIGGTDMGSGLFFHGAIDDVGIWNRSLSNTEIAALFNSLPVVAGCTHSNACNFNPLATINDGSCELNCAGCIDPCACNYNQNALFNDGSCDYSCNQGMTFITVFDDANSSGTFEANERPLQYWPVHIAELNKTVYSDASGMIIVPLPSGVIHCELVNNTSTWTSTTSATAELIVPGNTQVFFGLTNVTGTASAEATELAGHYEFIHCEYGLESGLYVRNTGGAILHGTLELTCDAQFTPTMPFSLSSPPNVSGPGFAQWNIQNLQPWETRLLATHLPGPGSTFNGAIVNYSFQLMLFDANDIEVVNSTFDIEKNVLCEEQASSLQTDPVGFNEAYHYVEDGTAMTFRVQFQNTTDEWAEDVLIIQNLNSQQFDLSSFEILYASEAMVGCLHDDGTIDLEFSNLVVAPVQIDPEEAGGYAVFRVRLNEGLTPDSTFYHEAHVVYDLNTVSGSDQVYHTIYDCTRLSEVIGEQQYCEGDTISLSGGTAWIDEYHWHVGDSLLSTEPNLHYVFAPGLYNVVCQFTNAVCDVCEHRAVYIAEAPQGSLVVEGNTIHSLSDDACQWYFNGLPIEGATYTVISAENSGTYQVFWINDDGCSAWSEEVLMNDMLNVKTSLNIYPNPATSILQVDLPSGNWTLALMSLSGQHMLSQQTNRAYQTIDLNSIPSGTYWLEARSEKTTIRKKVCVQK